MKQLLFFFLFLLPCLAWAQYPSNGNQKITLGEQTTADGLIFRGVLADTGIITPSSDTSAYIILDTVNHRFYNYNRATNVWSMAGVGSISSGLTGVLPVANGGTGQTTLAAAGINTGSGTINHLTKYSATGTTLANSNIRGIDGNLVITDLSYGLEAWNSNLSVIKLGLAASFFARKSGAGFYQANNFYHPFDPAINYKPVRMFSGANTAYYLQSFNTHTFYQEFSANPLAGDTITHVKSFEIDANGNVSIGNVTATEKLHVVGNGLFTGNVGIGSATPTTSGSGITFPATQSLSTNVNTLDDYEEGTFTPLLEGQISNPTVSYTSQIATYNKIGRLVTFEILLRANRTAGGSGRIRIAGLPFTCAEVYGYAATVGNSNIPTTLPFVGNVINSEAFILFYTNTFAVTEVSNWCSDCFIYCSGYYHTN